MVTLRNQPELFSDSNILQINSFSYCLPFGF